MGIKIGGSTVVPTPKDEAAERRELFQTIVRRYINRNKIEDVLRWLDTTDFYIAPASSQYHGNFRGGLCAHSLAVFENTLKLANLFFGSPAIENSENITEEEQQDLETLAIISLFHDLCKADFYTVSSRNVKDPETGKWSSVPFYAIEEQNPYGHGEKSVILLLQLGFPLTPDEILAINWHMGGWDARLRDYGGQKALGQAKKQCPLISILAAADDIASEVNGV